jgi:hypothetical protein
MFKVQHHDSKTLKWWYARRDKIEMQPPYQRSGGIWSVKDQAYLIDSIVNDYDIPKIYMADFTIINSPLNTSKKLYAVVDGKQRFEAIFAFFKGIIVLNNDIKYVQDPSVKIGGLTYNDLTLNYPDIAEKIDNYNLTIMSVITDEKGKIEDLFVRLNRSANLTGAEKRNAMPGPIPEYIRQLSEHKFFKERIKFDLKRGQDKNAAAKMLFVEYKKGFVSTKKANLDGFVEEAEEALTPPTSVLETLFSEQKALLPFQNAFERSQVVLDHMADIFTDRDPMLYNAGPLALYYWFVREQATLHKRYIREFLVQFEKARNSNRHLAATGNQGVDQELLSYDIINRSTDDAKSLERRYAVLEKRFTNFRQR